MENRKHTFNETLFLTEVTADEQLAIETCPSYNQALNKAIDDTYEWKRCRECALQVRTYPATGAIVVSGKCPKM